MKHSDDYHDYVFKDGKLIGDFENMYRFSKEVPWHQDKVIKQFQGKIPVEIIKTAFEFGTINKVLEIGCGYGHVLSEIYREDVEFHGFDISKTAIERASELHSKINFFTENIIKIHPEQTYDYVICREVLWYVINDLNTVLNQLKSLVAANGFLFIGLTFPSQAKPFLGKNILPNPDTLISLLNTDYENIIVDLCTHFKTKDAGPIFSWLGKKNERR